MVKPGLLLPHPGADSSLMERVPPTILTTPGGMILNLSHRPSRSHEEASLELWDLHFPLLLKFRTREGHLRVPRNHIEDGKKLGAWTFMKRARKRRGALIPEEERRLKEIGFIWRGQDGKWDSMVKLLTQFKRREGHLRVPLRHDEDGQKLGAWISMQRTHKRLGGTLYLEKERRLKEMGFIWCEHEAKWDTMFRALTQFKQREGHVRVPVLHVEDGETLGTWTSSQRCQKNAGTLVSEKESRLNEIGFIWIASKRRKWDTMFRRLTQFKQREGHLRVPTVLHVDDEGKKLGAWISKQRYQKNAGTLVSEKESRLNAIGFLWTTRKVNWDNWDTMFRALTKFKRREGHLIVPARHVEDDGKKLGAWISKQRYRKKAGTLVSEKESRLNEIGFLWNAHKGNWDTMFSALKQFKQREGHLRVPVLHVEDDGQKLGDWIHTQRKLEKNGKLVPEKERRLNEIGFIWNGNEEHFDAMVTALTQFKQREGHCKVVHSHIEHMHSGDKLKLGIWLRNECYKQRSELLDAQKEKRLESLGVTWNAKRREPRIIQQVMVRVK
jgi:hypothetical protein